jgi:NADPH2:quinone reductase
MATMKALVAEALAQDFSRVALKDVAKPEPGPGQVRVKVEAASLNFPDLLMLKGEYQFKPEPPFISGMDFAGRVDAVGEGVTGFKVAQFVAGGAKTGAFAEFTVAEAGGLSLAPEGMGVAQAAAYPAAYTTAHVSLIERGMLKAGEWLLVHGASGGVGMAAIDVGKIIGAKVIATTGSLGKARALKAYGADHVLLLENGFREQVKEITGRRGADVIFDPVGGDVFDESTRCIAFAGRLLVVGFAAGRIATVSTNMPLIKGFSVVGVRAGEYGRQFPAEGKRIREEIWRWAAERRTRPSVHAELPLERWREAFEMMKGRELVGKVVLRP